VQTKFAILIFFAMLAVSPRPATVAHANSSSPDAGSGDVVACRVLEAHSAAWPGVTLVLFHQRDKQDQSRLASLLKQKSGAQVGVKAADGDWKPATVIRLKSCFGRGLLLFPVGGETPKDGETFLLKFPSEKNGG
jgi:hypothetical protein